MMLDHRDALERRYDGPIPPADPATIPAASALRARLFQRMADDHRAQTAKHRRRLSAVSALTDTRLDRLQRDLHLSRSLGVAWRNR